MLFGEFQKLRGLSEFDLYSIISDTFALRLVSDVGTRLIVELELSKTPDAIARGRAVLNNVLSAASSAIARSGRRYSNVLLDKAKVAGIVYECLEPYFQGTSIVRLAAVELICRMCEYHLDALCTSCA